MADHLPIPGWILAGIRREWERRRDTGAITESFALADTEEVPENAALDQTPVSFSDSTAPV